MPWSPRTALPAGAARDAAIAAARAALITLLQHLADALEIVPGVTTTDLAGSGFPLRQAVSHTSPRRTRRGTCA